MTIQLAHKRVLAFIRGSSPAALEIDYMEYATDGAAQSAYVTSATAYTAQYPTAQSDTYVKATSQYSGSYVPYYSTDPAISLIGTDSGQQWLAVVGTTGTTRFHIDVGSAKIINRIYYENAHASGGGTTSGVNNFILQGSNTGAGTFDDLVYANDEGWATITGLSQNTFDQHVAANQADPKYITISGNTTAYRYYAIKMVDNHGSVNELGIRHIELQTAALNSFSESTIKTQGDYALKLEATTDALNETVTKTLTGGDILDITGKNTIKLDARSTGTGSNLQISIHDAGGTTTSHTINIASADTYQTDSWDISGVADADKDAIDQLQLKVLSGSLYPPAYSTTYVKATTTVTTGYDAWLATNPALSLTGDAVDDGWISSSVSGVNQRFHIDLGSSKVINKIYYENYHSTGTTVVRGVQNFTLWGSDNAAAFAELTYATDTNWTQITGLSQSTFDQHTAVDQSEPNYISFTGNTTAYRYYAFKFADNYGDGTGDSAYMGVRRIELQTFAETSYLDNIYAE